MKVDLEVIASTSIKRRKPWPQIVWVGTKQHSLLLVDRGRVSVLYIPSGKTKQKIPQLSNVIGSAVCVAPTPSGGDLVGVLESGDVFLWNKDSEKLHTICGLANILDNIHPSHGKCQVFASDDCTKILVAAEHTHLCLWQRDTSHTYLEGKGNTLVGHWSRVSAPEGITLPGFDCQEFCLHAMFTNSSLLGDCCDVSMVFNRGANMTICSVLIRFHPPDPAVDNKYPSINYEWKSLQYPLRNISSGCEPINIKGAYIPRYSPDSTILAVAVNQKSPADTSMLFVSPVTDMLLLSSMRGCGMRNPEAKRGKSYWVNDMAWLCDNLFVACMLSNGSAALLSRLGEPVAIATHGCSIDMGPAYFLPLHPLISIQSEEGQQRLNDREFEPSSADESEPLQQKFSVSSHPTLPILVFSDGFMVTFLQLPGDLSTFVFLRNVVLESSKHLKEVGDSQNLDITVANAYNLPGVEERAKSSPRRPKGQGHDKKHFSFEDLDGALNETVDSEVSMVLGPEADTMARLAGMGNLSSGKIVFGEPDLLQTVLDASEGEDGVMKSVVSAKHTMLVAWKVAATTTEPWTSNLDGVVRRLVDNLLKLFSVILDCPPVSEALERQQHSQPAMAVQTASLYQVISLYRHLLELAQFDALHQHLAPSILHLAHGTMATVLESRALQTTDPRLKTLSGCFTLLKFTEKMLNNLYFWLPKSVHSGGQGAHRALGDAFEPLPAPLGGAKGGGSKGLAGDRHGSQLSVDTAQLVAKRLAGSWKTLYKAVLNYQQMSQSEMNSDHASQLLSLIQQSLQAINASVPDAAAASMLISKGDKLSLDGKHTQAMNAWREQLKRYQETGNDAHAGKLLHSLLYTYLLQMDLLAAVELIDSLVVQANVQSAMDSHPLNQAPPIEPSFMTFVTNTLKSQAFHEPDMVPCIRDKSIRQVVQTLARFMASYFTNQTVYIFPPHNPQPLPAIHFHANIVNNRILPKYHEDISNAVRTQKLSSIWTVERALEYLLLSGLVCEAAWFAQHMGNWKTAFQLATACSLHRAIAPRLYQKPRRPLLLPDFLQPEEILHSKLAQMVAPSASLPHGGVLINDRTDMVQLSTTLEDILVAGVMGRVEVAPRILTLLVSQLKSVVKGFPPLVPAEFYLPAPPLYCPQPASSAKAKVSAAVKEENSLRGQTSSLVQLTLAVMNAAHLSIPSMRWYIHQLAAAQPKAVQFKTNTEGPCQNFPDILLEQLAEGSEFERVKGDRSIYSVLVSFRDLCSILWMLHARDHLSHCLRKREKYLGQLGYDNFEKTQWEGEHQSEWLSLCWASLRWASHLLPFTHFLSDEASVHKVLVSMLLELAPSTQIADLMAEFFHDSENIHPELQERLDKIMTDWQSIIVKPEDDGRSVRNSMDSSDGRKSVTFHGASPRGESLSVYFLKQQQAAKKVVKKKQRCFGYYEEYVFAHGVEPPKKLYVGARPFETKISFFDFLDMFCSVSFSKVLDKAKVKDRASSLPLLNCLCKDLLNQEMDYFVENVAARAHKKRGLLILAGTDPYASQDNLANKLWHEPQVQGKPTGLYQEKSFLDRSLERDHAVVIREQEGAHFDGSEAASPRQGGKQTWQLTVNFGKRYTQLQQLLEWLEVWSNKHHKFGLGRQEATLELRPSMKLQIPAQLIVLSLWLLEHKYSSASPQLTDTERGRRSMRSARGSTLSSSISPSGIRRGGNKRISPGRGRGRSRSASGSPLGRRVVEGVVEPGLEQSLPQSTLGEADQIRTAYEQLLEVPDDSSSVVVSSLASDELPDELQRTNNALRSGSPSRDNSALNHTLYMEQRSQSPYDRPRNPSPAPRSSTPTPRGRSPEHRSAGTSPIRSPPIPSPRSRGQRAAMNGFVDDADDLALAGGEGGLAQVLQQVIRKEMRRIVQIQQHSLNAMMGAIDGNDLPDPYPNHNQGGRYPQSGQAAREGSMRQALSELHNLQQQQPSSSSHGSPLPAEVEVMTRRSAGNLHTSQHSTASSRSRSRSEDRENQPPGRPSGIPQFLRIAAEREEDGFRLPIIPPPQQAWGVGSGVREGGAQHFPLLRLSTGPPQPGVYGPHSGSHLPAAAFLPPPPPPPPPSDAPLRPLSFQHVPPQVSSSDQDPLGSSGAMIGIPLLRLPATGFPQSSQEPLFGRLVPPEYLTAQMKEQERQEAEKQRYLRGFHQHMAAQYQAEAMAEDEREQREMVEEKRQRTVRTAAARRQRQQQKVQVEPEGESSRSEEAVPVKKVSTRPKSAKAKTPSPPQSTETEEEIAGDQAEAQGSRHPSPPHHPPLTEQDEAVLHDGYAIAPGVFEGYEHLEKDLGVEGDSDTRFQYKMAQAMRRQLEKERERWYQQRKVDFATNTRDYTDASVDVQRSFESIRTAEAATAITKDAGVDPVHEAIAEYNRTRQGVAVPPDVFMGLRFADGQEQTTGKTGGRAFLNVVDVHASSVLRDIPERGEGAQEADAEAKPASYLTRDTSPHRMGELESSLRAQLVPEQRHRHDAVTVSLFERRAPTQDRMGVALLPRDSTLESKTALVHRLRAMNDQMSAMDEVSRNIESEFHHSKMILETLQVMNDSYQPGDSTVIHTADSIYAEQKQDKQVDPNRLSAESFTPKRSGGSPVPSARVSARSAKSARSPSPQHSRKSEGSPRFETSRASNLSGISDLSDIIGEVLADGGVDLKAAGLTQEEADMYAARAKDKRRPHSPMNSYKELQTIVLDAEHEEVAKRSPEVHRRQIHQWMSEKYTERQNEYNRQRMALKEKEMRPFKPTGQVHLGTRDLRSLEEEREQRRHNKQWRDMQQRITEAEYLIGSAMTEAVETQQELDRSRSLSPRSRSRSTSPKKSPRTPSLGPSLTSGSPQRRDVRRSPQRFSRPAERDQSRRAQTMDQTFSIAAPPKGILKSTQSGSDIRPQRSGSGSQPIMVQPAMGSSDFEMTVESSADLRDYMSAIQNMDSSEDIDAQLRHSIRERTRPEPIPEKPAKAYKPKPFTEVVRMQRPQVTRKQASQEEPEEKYVRQVMAEKAAAKKMAESARSKSSVAEKPSTQRSHAEDKVRKAYAPLPMPTTPRRVKTYTERLKDLKPNRRYASPIIPRQHIPENASTNRSAASAPTLQRKATGPPHKPMTYVQQLKQINKAATVHSKTGKRGGRPSAPKTRMPARPAPHRPKTYTEQLQELNAPFKKTFRSTARAPSSLSSSRARPYGDPYSEDAHSVLSDWSVDDNVRKLLYDEEDAYDRYTADGTDVSIDHMVFAPSEAGASDYYEAIMGGSDPHLDTSGMDYRDSVDVSELERIAEVASVGSGSVLSVIDWDAVDKLIEDV